MNAKESVRAKIEESRRELLDLGNRNRLLSYRLLRAQGVEIVGESVAQVFRTLVLEGRTMSFRSGDGYRSEEPEAESAFPLPDSVEISDADQTDRVLQTSHAPAALDSRLLRTFRLANTTIEETGVNTLFLSLGMLHWYEADSSDTERLAPLVLVPVKLERVGVRQGFRVAYTGEDLGVNLSLIERVREFALTLPGADVLEPDGDNDTDPARYIKQVEEYVRRAAPKRWYVEPDRISLSFFSFNKLLMYLDLANAGIVENEVIAALFGDGFLEPPSDTLEGMTLDDKITPENTYHVLDADSSQAVAIRDAIGERNLVIQGPPGTGKSQTITNLIAECIARGKRVLFVSEKMAALEVVKRRLDNIGLGDGCLELHSHKTNKRATLDELGRVLRLSEKSGQSGILEYRRILAGGQGSTIPGLEELTRNRDRLNAYAEAVNSPVGQSGVSPQDAYGRLLALNRNQLPNPMSWKDFRNIHQWTAEDFTRKREVVEDLQRRWESCGVPSRHPFWGCRLQILLPSDLDQLAVNLEGTRCCLDALDAASQELSRELGLTCPDSPIKALELRETADAICQAPDLSGLNLSAPQWDERPRQIHELVEQGIQWQRLRQEFAATFLPQAWDQDLSDVRHALNTDGRKFLGRIFSSQYRDAKRRLGALLARELPKTVDGQIALLDAIQRDQKLRSNIDRGFPGAAIALGSRWQGRHSDWNDLKLKAEWWLRKMEETRADRFPNSALDILRTTAARPDGNAWRTGHLNELTIALSQSMQCYRNARLALQTALDMDNEIRFESINGLASLTFGGQRFLLTEWRNKLAELQTLVSFNNGVAAAEKEGLGPLVEVAKRQSEADPPITHSFDRAWYESIAEFAFSQRLPLLNFDGRSHESAIERFRELDQRFLIDNQSRVAEAHLGRASHVNDLSRPLVREPRADAPDFHERKDSRQKQLQLRFLRREIEKKSRHRPIRKLLESAGEVIQELKPVFMMSPLSIANYLAPGVVKFDLVVFDEASQVRPVDALGALSRARRAVVVGDSRQLPPTSFFDRAAQGDEPTDDDVGQSVTADIESVLRLFVSQAAPSRELRWHYRSRHESLIAVSNREFYNNNLVVFPSPDAAWESYGLRYHHLDEAVYDRGRSSTNVKEAEAVAYAVMEHARSCPGLSLGVAAFSQSQAQAIEDRLEVLRRRDDSGEDFFAAHPDEPFFVKNLENVQGDERDVIFISIGYGRDESGRVTQNFGPLNRDGGERRLNVLITRAKQQCHIFTNLNPEDISIDGNQGTRALRTFLEYAKTQKLPDVPYVSNFEVDSPFQHEVAARLSGCGYQVDQEVASGGRFIDIGIRDPDRAGRYIIGIECDGATYHSSPSARDRDRLREQQLRSLGWQLHRVWSTDWFRKPQSELERTISAIEQAKSG